MPAEGDWGVGEKGEREVTQLEVDPKNTFFFSDPHFDHKNIIKYCHRPFKNVEQMNKKILENYNKKIKHDSLVFFLGDMAFKQNSRPHGYWFKQLKGHIIAFKGNHDKKGYEESIIHVKNLHFKLSHFPANRGDWTEWMIHGHVHDKSPFIDYQNKMINVSVDATGFKPVKLSDIIKKIK